MSAKFADVVGGIVTFNPSKNRLLENLSALLSQVDYIYIYDNGSSNFNELRAWLDELDAGTAIKLYAAGKNRGMASALNEICARAEKENYPYALLMDQDSMAGMGMVAALRGHISSDMGLIGPLIVDRNEITRPARQDSIIEPIRVITSGSLVNIRAWHAVGGYDERLFVDWVDNEFCYNLQNSGYRVCQYRNAELLHELGRKEYVCNFIRFRDESGMPGLSWGPRYRFNYPDWRVRDRARGIEICALKYEGTRFGRMERVQLIRSLISGWVFEKNHLAFTRCFIEGWRTGKRDYFSSLEAQ